MAKRRETVEDLIAAVAEPGESITGWAHRAKFPRRTLTRALNGESELRFGSLTLLATLLQVDVARLRAAIDASRAESGK